MIVSFHPCFVGHANRLCAGRQPDREDAAAIRDASAVVLPQGCTRRLWEMARAGCTHVFPNFECRFRYGGKTGQTRLFAETGTPHPQTWVIDSVSELLGRGVSRNLPEMPSEYPVVMKYDWGGEGESVFLVPARAALGPMLENACRDEGRGRKGVVLQQYIPHDRCLRVAVVGQRRIAYWRLNPDSERFCTNLADGGTIDRRWRPDLIQAAIEAVDRLCRKTRIDLAGIDVLFDFRQPRPRPLILEVNHFFGRRGLGGSETYYRLLNAEIRRWLKGLGLTAPPDADAADINGDDRWPPSDAGPT
jgi:ribosomal protein S6--L-glutamate ligase